MSERKRERERERERERREVREGATHRWVEGHMVCTETETEKHEERIRGREKVSE